MAYADSLSTATTFIKHVSLEDGVSTPSATDGVTYWTLAYTWLNAKLSTAGITVPVAPSGTQAYTLCTQIEALRTSGTILRAVHAIAGHSTDEYSEWLLAEADRMVQEILDNPSILTDLGATSSIAVSTVADAYWVDNAQTDLDATDSRPVEPSYHFNTRDDF